MIVNLWSTPRTGSVWYSNYLKSQYPNSILLTEFFNQYHMNIYHMMLSYSKRINLYSYSTESWYDDYSIIDGKISIQKKFEKRVRSVEEEEEYRIHLFNQIDTNFNYILHNHVSPINEKISKLLTEVAEKNIYIYRKDKRAQLASYAIAFSTKQFVQYSYREELGIVSDIDIMPLENLVKRIKVWDSLIKDNIVAYEDIDFFDNQYWPKKQNKDWRQRLSSNMINIIENLVAEYESST